MTADLMDSTLARIASVAHGILLLLKELLFQDT